MLLHAMKEVRIFPCLLIPSSDTRLRVLDFKHWKLVKWLAFSAKLRFVVLLQEDDQVVLCLQQVGAAQGTLAAMVYITPKR